MERIRIEINDGTVTGLSFGDRNKPVEVVFLHANGFNAMTYQSLLEPLNEHLHVVALDMRGHGRNTLPANPKNLKGWNTFRDDIVAALNQIAPHGCILAGHSMGGCIATLIAAQRKARIKGLVLADPVLLTKQTYFMAHLPFIRALVKNSPMSEGAKRRRSEFDSREQAYNKLKDKRAFKTWREPFLENYLDDGLIKTSDDMPYKLSCAPSWEAACFSSHRHRPWQAFRRFNCPAIILTAEHGSTTHPEALRIIKKDYPDIILRQVRGTTHFLPMETPYEIRDAILDMYEMVMAPGNPEWETRTRRSLTNKALPD